MEEIGDSITPWLVKSIASAHRERAEQTFHEVEQTLGKALGYPWFKDDPKNFPDATEEDGVCVGEHVPETIALEAANEMARKDKQNQQFQELNTAQAEKIRALESRLRASELAGAEVDKVTRKVIDHNRHLLERINELELELIDPEGRR